MTFTGQDLPGLLSYLERLCHGLQPDLQSCTRFRTPHGIFFQMDLQSQAFPFGKLAPVYLPRKGSCLDRVSGVVPAGGTRWPSIELTGCRLDCQLKGVKESTPDQIHFTHQLDSRHSLVHFVCRQHFSQEAAIVRERNDATSLGSGIAEFSKTAFIRPVSSRSVSLRTSM